MRSSAMKFRCLSCALLLSAVALAGCGAPTADFRRYETFAHKVAAAQDFKFKEDQRRDIDTVWKYADWLSEASPADVLIFAVCRGMKAGRMAQRRSLEQRPKGVLLQGVQT